MTHIRLRLILCPSVVYLKRTICCVQYCIRAGLERKEAEGTRLASSAVRWRGRGGRGKISGEPGSAGPGTNIKYSKSEKAS